MLDHADAYNKPLKNGFSKLIISKLMELIPGLIKERHLEVAEKLLNKCEDQNQRLGSSHETTIEILKL